MLKVVFSSTLTFLTARRGAAGAQKPLTQPSNLTSDQLISIIICSGGKRARVSLQRWGTRCSPHVCVFEGRHLEAWKANIRDAAALTFCAGGCRSNRGCGGGWKGSRAVSQLPDDDQPRKVQSEVELPVDSSRTTSSLSTSLL